VRCSGKQHLSCHVEMTFGHNAAVKDFDIIVVHQHILYWVFDEMIHSTSN
jgi:hypothetical protein